MIKNVLKLFSEALADFNQALKLKPDNGGVLLGRGISKFYLGDKPGACEDWRTASARGATGTAALIAEYCEDRFSQLALTKTSTSWWSRAAALATPRPPSALPFPHGKWEYVRHDPVRAGLVQDPDECPW